MEIITGETNSVVCPNSFLMKGLIRVEFLVFNILSYLSQMKYAVIGLHTLSGIRTGVRK
jgi:hypothetical protein